jgi:hypothetical protein
MSRHVGLSASTIKEILIFELGSRKYPRKWVPHLVGAPQKNDWRLAAMAMLELLREREPSDVSGIATGDESQRTARNVCSAARRSHAF